ncbi:MAG: CinA family nicotinamide mononucleotide deamidase-related protein [Planctomycetes bacterium]|nr:CinA family nicotinamide mononucleotide deamidase-related protein [Planctomycetota bacterium]
MDAVVGPRVELVSIGDELVAGTYPDLNAMAIASRLRERGVAVTRFHVIDDDEQSLVDVLREIRARAACAIATGGLGPTLDDRTRAGAARAFERELVRDERVVRWLRTWFESRGRRFTDSNLVQADFPKDARILENRKGTAPGFHVAVSGFDAFFLPGPPREAMDMFEHGVLPHFTERRAIRTRRLHGFGISESLLGERLAPFLVAQPGRRCGITVRKGVLTVNLQTEADTSEEAERLLAAFEGEVLPILDDLLYGRDGESIADVLARTLRDERLTIALAESCTGGLATKLLTDVAGISENLLESFVTYTNAAKQARLGVDPSLLEEHGAVSAEVACAMARGVRRVSQADVGVAITGIAGPTGGTLEKPVGLVYLAVATERGVASWKRTYPPTGRAFVRDLAARDALYLTWGRLRGRVREPDRIES